MALRWLNRILDPVDSGLEHCSKFRARRVRLQVLGKPHVSRDCVVDCPVIFSFVEFDRNFGVNPKRRSHVTNNRSSSRR